MERCVFLIVNIQHKSNVLGTIQSYEFQLVFWKTTIIDNKMK